MSLIVDGTSPSDYLSGLQRLYGRQQKANTSLAQVRDRILGLGVCIPLKIKTNEFHLPLLDESDHETALFLAEATDMLGGCEILKKSA